jgi:hypothetical protein
MQKPDDAAADATQHEYCSGPFASDAARRQRIARNFARDDGLRVQQELNRYATAADAGRALQEFLDAFARCASYEPQPGLRIELAPWTAPPVTADRAGAHMTLHPTAQPTIHATLAAYRAGAVLMVLSIVAEQPEPTVTWHNQVAPTAVRRARLAAEQETR